ncbi:MAG: YciI-like protein [Actinomycetota bacterium]|nr:YciI-like protein [Actinomycetota bacterium]
MHWLLFYDYVDDIAARRAPFREAHLALVREANAAGTLLLAGALADPLDGAVFVFSAADDPSAVEDFVARDPYVREGLVTGWRVRAWTVVVGADRST